MRGRSASAEDGGAWRASASARRSVLRDLPPSKIRARNASPVLIASFTRTLMYYAGILVPTLLLQAERTGDTEV